MKLFLKKFTAVMLLVLYAINPLHTALHCSHGEEHQCRLHSHSKTAKILKSGELKITLSHDCYLCQNSQSKNHYINGISPAVEKNILTQGQLLKISNSTYLSLYGFFVESRGPPSFI